MWSTLLSFGLALLGVASAAHAMLNKRDPRAGIGWVAMCLLLPLTGAAAYWILGVNRIRTRGRKLGQRWPSSVHGSASAHQPELRSTPETSDLPQAARLGENVTGKPLLAECGGMLVLLDELADADGVAHPMAGLMPGRASMQKRLAALGLQSLDWPEGELRGHTFHYSTMATPWSPVTTARNPNAGRAAEALYIAGSLRASYVHHYFPSNPAAVAAFFGGATAAAAKTTATADAHAAIATAAVTATAATADAAPAHPHSTATN